MVQVINNGFEKELRGAFLALKGAFEETKEEFCWG
jgi:hypothetical protein